MDFTKVINNLCEFKENYPEFYDSLMQLVEKYKDSYYKNKGFSLRYRDLFRILSQREREPWVLPGEYDKMKQDVYMLKIKDPEVFEKFSLLIKKYVVYDENGIGYSSFISCMYEVDMKFKNSDTINTIKTTDIIDMMEKIDEKYSKLLKSLEELKKSL
ncbi:hypothetical protein EDC21_104183 [Thermohydrogenium kirishiense]|uniref:hypothetical protein n=1 Tax=Thermoanaerobacterium thermosaccharolyticum TaxID=1517 RepID=UPI00104FCB13|nr:hypothetical protein EDC21_104183 [Thermohydrogenium kirishiense]